MNIGASMPALPLNISVPPNHRTIAIVAVPRNSLMGWASD